MTDTELAFVLGTRPEIIKLAPVLKECDRRGLSTHVVHTGQHYSDSLDEIFFEQLELDLPDVNLAVGSGTHGEQTGEMLAAVEAELLEHEPSVVLVQGDTNSTLAGALAGAKLNINVGHIEAGLRSFDREMPEETNRIVVDHVSDHLFPPTTEMATLLRKEGLPDSRITVTGNTVVDAITAYDGVAAETSEVLSELDLQPGGFALLTAHRAETVDDRESFANVLDGVARAADRLDLDVVYPIHPRAQERLDAFGISVPEAVRTIEPLGFIDFLRLESTAALAFTDSGGVQEETCVLGTPCVTLRYGTERPETAFAGANVVAGHDPADIVDAASLMHGKVGSWDPPFGDGQAAGRIVDALSLTRPARVADEAD